MPEGIQFARVLRRELAWSRNLIILPSREMGGPCNTNVGKRNTYRLLVGKPEGKRPLGRPRLMWVDNIRMDLGEVGWGDVDCIGLAKDRNRWIALVDSVLKLRVP
jgi:hypothetical protein